VSVALAGVFDQPRYGGRAFDRFALIVAILHPGLENPVPCANDKLALIIGGTDNFTFFLLHATAPNLTDTSVTIPVAPSGRRF
jgi:hypothetical protein